MVKQTSTAIIAPSPAVCVESLRWRQGATIKREGRRRIYIMPKLKPIPEYTKDDFLNTESPYEWLCQFLDNKFALQQMVQRMKEYAGSVGVKTFVGLWNAYLENRQKENGVKADNATEFDGQPVELFCGKYICKDYGVSILDRFGFEQIICRHPIMPVKRLVNIDTGEERLELAYRKGRAWRSIIAEKSVIASSSQILQLAAYGVLVNTDSAKALSSYIMDIEELNYETLPEQKSVSRLGWVMNDGFSPYVEGLQFDGESNFRHVFGAVKQNGDRDAWLSAMKKLRAEKSAGRLFLAASFASALIQPCGLLPFFLHAWGATESGKTVGLMIAASVWANPKMGEYITTFNSTSVGQEMMASFLNSLPLCMDELQIQSANGTKDFDKIIYQLTEGVGRTRGAKAGGLQKQGTWKNCIITNGEHPISNANSGGGAVNRIIEFECVDKVFSDLPWICSVIAQNYGWAGREFVEYIQQEGMMDIIKSVQKQFYAELLQSDSTDKQAASASIILTADAIATDILFEDDNALTVEDLQQIMTKKSDVDANARALEYIYELVVRNPLRFKPDSNGDWRGEVWGKEDDDYIYIVKSVFDLQMKEAGFNATAFLSWAKRKNILQCDKDGRRTKKAAVNKTVLNTVCLVKDPDKLRETENKVIYEMMDIL